MAEAVTAKRKVAGKVEERVKAGKCLHCEAAGTRRGLCMRHYQQFLARMRERGNKAAQAEFEANAIREGKVLAIGQCREIKREDPFGDL